MIVAHNADRPHDPEREQAEREMAALDRPAANPESHPKRD
jgi:hypothetical protein